MSSKEVGSLEEKAVKYFEMDKYKSDVEEPESGFAVPCLNIAIHSGVCYLTASHVAALNTRRSCKKNYEHKNKFYQTATQSFIAPNYSKEYL